MCRGASEIAGETCGTCPLDCGPCTVANVDAGSPGMVRSQCVDPMAYTLAFDGPDTGYVHVLPHGMQEGPLHVQGPLGFMRLEGVSVKGPPTVAFSRVFF